MTYVVTKIIKGNPYLYLVRSVREGDRVIQKFVRYLGRADSPEAQARASRAEAEEPEPITRGGRPIQPTVAIAPPVEPEAIKITRIGEVSPEGSYFGIEGQTTYEGGKPYTLSSKAKIADTRDIQIADSLINETLNNPALTSEDRVRLTEALGQGNIDYKLFDETLMSESAIKLGYDGVRVVENTDYPGEASSIFLMNTETAIPEAVATPIEPETETERVDKALRKFEEEQKARIPTKEEYVESKLAEYQRALGGSGFGLDIKTQRETLEKEYADKYPSATQPPETKTNPYLEMPIKRVERDARHGVKLAKEALAQRESELEPIVEQPSPETEPTPPTEEIAIPSAKEPWEMTKAEWKTHVIRTMSEDERAGYGKGRVELAGTAFAPSNFHEQQVQQALSEGKPVSPEVLKDYPELVKPKAPEPTPPTEQELTPEPEKEESFEERLARQDKEQKEAKKKTLEDIKTETGMEFKYLKPDHIKTIANLARSKDSIYLFEAPSLSGDSMTIRYRRDWVDSWRGYQTPRYETSMVFSVKVPQKEWDSKKLQWVEPLNYKQALDKYNAMAEEAKQLFNAIRKTPKPKESEPTPTPSPPVTPELDITPEIKTDATILEKDFNRMSHKEVVEELKSQGKPLLIDDPDRLNKLANAKQGYKPDMDRPVFVFKGIEEGVITDGFLLIENKDVAEDIYSKFIENEKRKEVRKDMRLNSNLTEQEARENVDRRFEANYSGGTFPNYKNLYPTELGEEVKLVGVYAGGLEGIEVPNEAETLAYLSDGEHIMAVNADKLAFVLKHLPDAKMYFADTNPTTNPLTFTVDNEHKGMLMPMAVSDIPPIVREKVTGTR